MTLLEGIGEEEATTEAKADPYGMTSKKGKDKEEATAAAKTDPLRG